MNILFLDYDGVVNIPMWDDTGKTCNYNHPHDGRVNHFQATQWISEFCLKYNYKIVVTSTWRLHENYKECLRRGGLRDAVEILDRTPRLLGKRRGDEIKAWLDAHPNVEHYIIIDDENAILDEQKDHFLQTDEYAGFTMANYFRCEGIHAGTKSATRVLVDRVRQSLSASDDKVSIADIKLNNLVHDPTRDISGTADALLKLWLQSWDKHSVEQMFYLFTDTDFDAYLIDCIKDREV